MKNQRLIELGERLLETPNKIKELQGKLIILSEEMRENNERILVIENEIKSDILSSVDSAGKKVFTNSESRDSAFIERSSDNQILINEKLNLKSLKNKMDEIKTEIEFLNNDQRNIRTILEFFSSIND
jgi:hypothetical protein